MNTIVNKIDYDEIVNIVHNQLIQVMSQDVPFYKGYTLIVTKEQQFIKKKYKYDPKTICIVLKFGGATVNYFQSVLPCTITALSEANQLRVCQRLLTEYVEYFNLIRVSEGTIQQIYNTPDFSNNFENEMYGFKSLATLSAAFVLSKTANFFSIYNIYGEIKAATGNANELKVVHMKQFLDFIHYSENYVPSLTSWSTFDPSTSKKTYTIIVTGDSTNGYSVSITEAITGATTYTYGTSKNMADFRDNVGIEFTGTGSWTIDIQWEEFPTLTQDFTSNLNLDSQVMYEQKNFSTSIGKYGTNTLTIATYFTNDLNVFNEALAICTKNRGNTGVNETFALYLKFTNQVYYDAFKLMQLKAAQNLGEIPSSSYVFAN